VPRLLRTWSFRLTLLYAALFAVSVVVLFGIIYWSALDYAKQDEANENNVEFHAIVDEAELAGYAQLPRILQNHIQQREGTPSAYLLEDTQFRKIAGNIEPMPFRDDAFAIKPIFNGKTYKLSAHFYRMPDGNYLLIGQDSPPLKAMKALVARAFGVSAATTLILAVVGGGIISVSVLGRVEAVARTSREIIAGNLSQRVPVRGSDDEFDHLALSVNAMLDRIEDLMRNMRQVSNDIAHDLRTPLTRLRQRLEKARRHNHSVEQMRETIGASIRQVDAILETFGALLRIAQIEAGQGSAAHAEIDLTATLKTIAEDFAPAAEDRGQTLVTDIRPGLVVAADRELVVQMIVNLLENALRYAPAGAVVTIAAMPRGGGIAVSVLDTGPGIPKSERENVLRPFYRLESSRTTEGSGLGLSLVAAIAKRHGATLELGDNDPGLCATVRFPTAVAT
jgi:signal transduction histidine kinase